MLLILVDTLVGISTGSCSTPFSSSGWGYRFPLAVIVVELRKSRMLIRSLGVRITDWSSLYSSLLVLNPDWSLGSKLELSKLRSSSRSGS
jgi:hypothetical protein